ncbi:MAG: PQQ-binding-like beta-propeller repeat protein [Planctomycetota bacterium]
MRIELASNCPFSKVALSTLAIKLILFLASTGCLLVFQTRNSLAQPQSRPSSQSGVSSVDSEGDVVAPERKSVDLEVEQPPALLSPAYQLSLEQIEDLIVSEEYGEAIEKLESLLKTSEEQIVALGKQQHAGTISVQTYEPLRQRLSRRLLKLTMEIPEVELMYQEQVAKTAEVALAEWSRSKDLRRGQQLVAQFRASALGEAFSKKLMDLYLERGWALAALAEAQQFCPELRILVRDGSQATLPWPLVFEQMNGIAKSDVEAWLRKSWSGLSESRSARMVEAMRRVLQASHISDRTMDPKRWFQWWSELRTTIPDASWREDKLFTFEELPQRPKDESVSDWFTFAGNAARCPEAAGTISPNPSVRWSWSVPLYMATGDQVPASQPRVAESEQGTLPYHPVVAGGKVYVNTMTQILAFEQESGKPWTRSGNALFESHTAPGAYLPLRYPLVGVPRGTLSISGQELFARMGAAVTGSANPRRGPGGRSVSYLVGLDLNASGEMLPGFPLYLIPNEFEDAEFDGPPIVFGDFLIAPVVVRDNVGLHRGVAAFYRDTGELAWKSPVLASGLPEGSEQANLISHQLVTVVDGRVFYNTNLGSIVCLDALTGNILWLSQYSRDPFKSNEFPGPDRFRYRDRNPCMVSKGLVYSDPLA